MVESNPIYTNALEPAVEQTLAFFDQVFEAVPQIYRPIDKQANVAQSKDKKKSKQGKEGKKVSLMELNERAHERIEEIRRANALKSQQKIKQLSEQHAISKKDKPKKAVPTRKDSEDIVMDSDDDDNGPEETKQPSNGKKNGKNGKNRREPLEAKE